MGYRYGYNMMWGRGFWFLCFIVMIVIIFVIYKLTSSGVRNLPRNHSNEDPLEILKMRYAKGEIDEEQYKKIRDTLMNK